VPRFPERRTDHLASQGSLVAVSPQTPDNSLELVESHSLTFEALSDVRSYVASDHGIVFALTPADRELFLGVASDLSVVNDDDAWLAFRRRRLL
jgi:peroxiredoxin